MCCDPTYTASAEASDSLPHASSSGRPRIEYSSSEPCALTRNGSPERGTDRAAHQDVVGEHEVGREQLAQRRDVRLDVPAALLGA